MRPPRPESWNLEVQIHPSDIRKRVRYLFLSRRQITGWSILVLLYLLAVALAVAVAPGVVTGVIRRHEYGTLTVERNRQGERLQALVSRLEVFGRRAAELDMNLEKVFLVYGLPPAASRRPPAPAAARVPVPDSIYAGDVERGDRLRNRIRERLREVDAALTAVQSFERAHPEEVQTTPSISPLRGDDFVLVSGFGNRRSPFTRNFEFHPGLDLAAPVGTPVHATADGVVVFAGEYPLSRSRAWWRYGNLVIVEDGTGFVTLYGHNDQILVRRGQPVRRGDPLATVGNSGWSTSPHLHYEVRRKGADGVFRPADPLIFILDHRWPNEERLLARARSARPVRDFEPLPSFVGR